jgi:PEP-CTERM motif
MKSVLFFALALIFAISDQAGATPIAFSDTTLFTPGGTIDSTDYIGHGWGSVNVLNGTLDFVTWKHQFDLSPPADKLLTATLTVSLQDDERDTFWNPLTWEVGVGWTENGQWDFGSVDSSSYNYGIDVNYLKDGVFTVTLASLWGDFSIVSSTLDITYNPVPEPATMILLGSGLLGLAAFRRMFS